MAAITIQAAVVSVSLTDKTSTGFDWTKFQVALEGRQSRLNPTTNTTTPNNTTPNNNTNTNNGLTGNQSPTCATCKVTGSPLDSAGLQQVDPGSVIDLSKNGLVLGKTAMGNYFGTYGALSVASAINFLSEFGNAKIDQNVQLKTLSGTDVKFRSGQIVPYVSGVAATSAGYNSNVTGSSATDTVDTGLTVVMTPLYDADTQLVTMNVDLSLKSILQFVQLNAGNQLGTFSQPLVQDQELNDIVRTPAGRTIVIGGLQIDNEQFNGSEPVALRNIFAQAGTTPDVLSSRAQDIKRDALFVILRPTVTVFVPEGR
jgi:type II secretory pathway component GspD/PulD (secretin)